MTFIKNNFLFIEEGLELFKEGLSLYNRIKDEHFSRLAVPGLQLGFLDFGSPDGVPLIWAHGSCSTSYEVLSIQEGLVKIGYRVIAVDYRGHGASQIIPDGNNTSIYHIADDIAFLMDHLGIGSAVIGGLSKGGWVAAAFYDSYPHLVRGLLLEDGGSFSALRLNDEIACGMVKVGKMPYRLDIAKELYDPGIYYKSLLDGVRVAWEVYSPARKTAPTIEYLAWLVSLMRENFDYGWSHHCDYFSLMVGMGDFDQPLCSDGKLYSLLPIMQLSQELMIPKIIFRNLNVPMHIIDPDSPTDWLPVRHQNEELQAMHPDLIVHEVYEYEHSPHEAHFERPERFIVSAKALLNRLVTAK